MESACWYYSVFSLQEYFCYSRSPKRVCLKAISNRSLEDLPGSWGSLVSICAPNPNKGSGNNNMLVGRNSGLHIVVFMTSSNEKKIYFCFLSTCDFLSFSLCVFNLLVKTVQDEIDTLTAYFLIFQ